VTSEIAESGCEGSGAEHEILFQWSTERPSVWFCGAVIITAGVVVGGVFRQSAGGDEPDGGLHNGCPVLCGTPSLQFG